MGRKHQYQAGRTRQGTMGSLASPHCGEPEARPGSLWVPIWRAKAAGWADSSLSASAQGCESLCAPRWWSTERGGDGGAEKLFHKTLEQLPVNTLGKGCQSKQCP